MCQTWQRCSGENASQAHMMTGSHSLRYVRGCHLNWDLLHHATCCTVPSRHAGHARLLSPYSRTSTRNNTHESPTASTIRRSGGCLPGPMSIILRTFRMFVSCGVNYFEPTSDHRIAPRELALTHGTKYRLRVKICMVAYCS